MSAELKGRHRQVVAALDEIGPACSQAIADHLNAPMNSIGARVFELRELGLVTKSHRAMWEPTKRNVNWWKLA